MERAVVEIEAMQLIAAYRRKTGASFNDSVEALVNAQVLEATNITKTKLFITLKGADMDAHEELEKSANGA